MFTGTYSIHFLSLLQRYNFIHFGELEITYSKTLSMCMLCYYEEAHLALFNENRSYKFDLNKFEKPYLNAYMNQIS